MIRDSGFVTNGSVHVYSGWFDAGEELPALRCRSEVDHAMEGEAVSRAKVEIAQRFRVALANLQTLTGSW